MKIGFLVKQPEEPWFQNEWTFAQQCADKNGFELIKIGVPDGEKALSAIDNLAAQGAQGFVICTPNVRIGPAIVAKARQQKGSIFWGDETGLRSDDVRGRSYAPRGRTPMVRPSHKRANLGVISAVTNQGKLRWMVLHKAITAPVLIRFLERLIRDAESKVFLILDRLRVHRSGPVWDWLAQHISQIEVFYLPAYSPELNPDEGINGDLKQAVPRKPPARSRPDLQRNAISHMRRLSKSPKRIRSLFQNPAFRYAA